MSDSSSLALEGSANLSDRPVVTDDRADHRDHSARAPNLGTGEAWASTALGAAMVWRAVHRRSLTSVPLAAVGAALIYRGSTRTCHAYSAAGIDRSKSRSGPDAVGAVTINKPAEEIYRFWRDLSNLPKFINVLDSVEVLDEQRSRWHTRELGGQSFRYEAEVTEDTPDNGIRWRSVSGTPIEMRGSVRFKKSPVGRGTIVIGSLVFGRGTGGAIAGRIASPFARYEIHQDLMRLKQLLEAGEIATADDQPVGPRGLDARKPDDRVPNRQAPRFHEQEVDH